jgi:hypothetical protein
VSKGERWSTSCRYRVRYRKSAKNEAEIENAATCAPVKAWEGVDLSHRHLTLCAQLEAARGKGSVRPGRLRTAASQIRNAEGKASMLQTYTGAGVHVQLKERRRAARRYTSGG